MIYSQHTTEFYIFQHRAAFITFIDDFVLFFLTVLLTVLLIYSYYLFLLTFYFFPCSRYMFHFPCFLLNKAFYLNNELVPCFLSGLSHRHLYASIRILCYPSATAVLKICPRKWLLCFYKFKNLIETSINRSRKASSKC